MLIDSSALIKISKEIGNKIDYVQGGGGNTSYKINDETMLIKASGTLLKEMNVKVGYVALKYDEILSEINKIETKTQKSEEEINKVIMDKRIQLDKVKPLRPSIETGFHMLLDKAVIHSHSVYSNIYNCSQEGKSLLKNLLKEEDYVFIPYDSPGLGLTLLIKKTIDNHKGIFKVIPKYLFLENHGVIVNAKDENTAIEYHREINMTLKKSLKNLSAYPKLTVNKDLLSKNKYVFDVLKGSSFNFENVLFPDQVVYFKGNISYNIDPFKKINILFEDEVIKYNVSSLVEANAIEETLLSYLYIYQSIKENALTHKFLGDEEQKYISEMEVEKYRKKVIERGGE